MEGRRPTPEHVREVEPERFDDFDISKLVPSKEHGGSSRLYFLGENRVVKESLEAIQDLEAAQEKVRRILNNIEVLEQYLGDRFLKTHCLIKERKDGDKHVYLVQERAPKGAQSMNPDAWDMVFDDETREHLASFIQDAERMYEETGMMLDLLALDNVFFDPYKREFYFIDPDPVLCKPEDEERLATDHNVSSHIVGDFQTYNGTPETDAIKANMEHLELLRGLLQADQ